MWRTATICTARRARVPARFTRSLPGRRRRFSCLLGRRPVWGFRSPCVRCSAVRRQPVSIPRRRTQRRRTSVHSASDGFKVRFCSPSYFRAVSAAAACDVRQRSCHCGVSMGRANFLAWFAGRAPDICASSLAFASDCCLPEWANRNLRPRALVSGKDMRLAGAAVWDSQFEFAVGRPIRAWVGGVGENRFFEDEYSPFELRTVV